MQDRGSSSRCLRAFVRPAENTHCAPRTQTDSQTNDARGLHCHQLGFKSLIYIITRAGDMDTAVP